MATYEHFEVGWTTTNGYYIPPDFDPKKLHGKFGKKKSAFIQIRNMAPFTSVCLNCGEIIGRGTKFNMRGEIMKGNDEASRYLGMKNWMFGFNCPGCRKMIKFRTDYKTSDYEIVQGAKMGKELWWKECRAEARTLDAQKRAQYEQEQAAGKKRDAMTQLEDLETRAEKTKNHMETIDAIEECMDMNRGRAFVDQEEILEKIDNKRKRKREELTENEQGKVEAAFRHKRLKLEENSSSSAGPSLFSKDALGVGASDTLAAAPTSSTWGSLGTVVKKKKKRPKQVVGVGAGLVVIKKKRPKQVVGVGAGLVVIKKKSKKKKKKKKKKKSRSRSQESPT